MLSVSTIMVIPERQVLVDCGGGFDFGSVKWSLRSPSDVIWLKFA